MCLDRIIKHYPKKNRKQITGYKLMERKRYGKIYNSWIWDVGQQKIGEWVTSKCSKRLRPEYDRGFHIWLEKPSDCSTFFLIGSIKVVYVKVKGEGFIVKGIDDGKPTIVCRRMKIVEELK